MTWFRRVAALLFVVATLLSVAPGNASAAVTPLTSITLLPGTPSTSAIGIDYAIGFSGGVYVRCVRIHFSTTTTFGGGSLPAGMSLSGSTLLANGVGWTATTSGDYIQGTFGAGDTPNGATALRINTLTNASASGTYYAQIEGFSDLSCLTQVELGVVAYDLHNYTTLTADVDPALGFTVANKSTTCNGESNLLTTAGGATTIALGNIGISSNVSGAQTLTVTGNSANGFTVYMRSTQASTNLYNTSHNWVDAAGTYPTGALLGSGERFGYTFKDSTTSTSVTNPASAFFIKLDNTSRAIMGSSTSNSGTGCVTFDAQTGPTTPAGNYSATVIYTVIPTF